jgi:RecA-family ATPase
VTRYFCSLPNHGEPGGVKELFTDDPQLIERFIKAEDRPGRGVYECINPLVSGARRRSLDTVAELRRLYFDLDLPNIDASRDDAITRLRQLPTRFAWGRDSGSGNLHVGIRIKDPPLPGTPEYDRAVALWKSLAEKLAADPAPVHPAALIRCLGTHNTKNGNSGQCRQLWGNDEAIDLSELEELDELLVEPLLVRKAKTNGGTPPESTDARAPVDVDRRLANMRWHGDGDTAINVTQRDVMASLLRHHISLAEATSTVFAATRQCVADDPAAANWDWHREKLDIAWSGARLVNKDPTLVDRLPDALRAKFVELAEAGKRPSVHKNKFGLFVTPARGTSSARDYGTNYSPGGAARTKTNMIRELLLKGTTVQEILDLTGWSSVSVPQHAHKAGLKLAKSIEDGVIHYKGTPIGGADSPPSEAPKAASGRRVLTLRPFTPFDVATLPPRSWLYGRHYQRRTVSLTAGPGGMGKSSHDMVEAIAMVTCRNLLGEQPEERLRIWYHNGEDPRDEINRRLAAICQHYKIPQEELQGYLWTTSGTEFPLRVAKGYANLEINTVLVREISAAISENQIDVAIFDPLVTLHSVSEVDTGKMDAVVRLFAGIAEENDASIELAHHVRKPAAGAASDYDVHDIRGVAAITDAVRAARVLNRMNEKDAEAAGCSETERLSRFRVDRAKGNYSPACAATWRQFINVALINGDEVGVVAPWDFPGQGAPTPEKDAADRKAEQVFLQLLDKYVARGTNVSVNPGPTYAPAKFAEEREAKTAKVGKAALRAAMSRLLDAGRIQSEPHGRSGREARHLVPA